MTGPLRRLVLVLALALVLAHMLALAGCRGCGDAAVTRGGEARAAVASPGDAPALEIAGRRLQVGFGQRVELSARIKGGRGDWTFRWRQIWGPGAGPGSKHHDGATMTLKTVEPPPRAEALEHVGGVLPLSAARAGRVVLALTASSSAGQRLRGEVEVIPAFTSAAWPRAAPGVDVYLPVAAGAERWRRQEGQLQVQASRFPYLLRARWVSPQHDTSISGQWNTLAHGATTLKVRTGPWQGGRDCGRFDCHPTEHRGWLQTNHATILRRALTGQLPQRRRGRYSRRCLSCHTLGYQPGVNNDGFADRAAQLRWQLPSSPRKDGWSRLPVPLKEHAGVQCESCHGPGWFYTGYGDDICARCHDLPPRYPNAAQARKNRMHQADRSLSVAGAAQGPACKQCHVGRAFLRSLRGHDSGSRPKLELETKQHGIRCPSCHDPHASRCPRQLRLCGEVEIPGATFNAGQGALCIACHTGEANVIQGGLLRPFLPGSASRGTHGRDETSGRRDPAAAPHAPQFQLLTGRGGQFLALPGKGQSAQRSEYPHQGVPDSCVGCHHDRRWPAPPAAGDEAALASHGPLGGGHSFKLVERPTIRPRRTCATDFDWSRLRRSKATATCARCHGALATLDATARGDYDGDGKVRGLVAEVQGLMQLLRRELEAQIAALKLQGAGGAVGVSFTVVQELVVVADSGCRPLKAGGAWLTMDQRAPLLHKAAHNYLLLLRDGSGGLHNPQYSVKLLQDAVEGLERRRGGTQVHRWKRP